MPKVTEYKVEGVLAEKPKDLPKELTVTEIVTDVPTDVTAQSIYGTTFRVTQYESGTWSDHIRVDIKEKSAFGRDSIDTSKVLDKDNAIILRDGLTELIGDGPETRLRHVVDDSGYIADWYEVAPNEFYNESSRTTAETRARNGNFSHSFSYIESEFGIKSISFE